MTSIKTEIDYINEARNKLATALITKFGVQEQDIVNSSNVVTKEGLKDKNGVLKRLHDWAVLVTNTNVHTDNALTLGALNSSGAAVGTDTTFDGSAAVSFKLKAGNNITLTQATKGLVVLTADDTKVTLTLTTTSNTSVRPLLLGAAYGTDSALSGGNFKEVTDAVKASTNVYVKPSTGALYASALYSGGDEVLKVNGSNGTADGVSALLNKLTTGTSNPQDNDYFISQYAGGGTTTTTYHRRPVSALYNYIKTKLAISNSGPTLAWGTTSTVGSVGGVDLKVTMPANPNTWRPITLEGEDKLSATGGTTLDFKAGNAATVTYTSGGHFTFGVDSTKSTNWDAAYTHSTSSHLALGTTSTTAAAGNHTHTTKIETSTGTNQITLAHGSKYSITAGETSYIFTMPSIGTVVAAKGAADTPVYISSANTASAVTSVKASLLGVMTGATTSADGAKGAVPAPTKNDVAKFLKGDGTWSALPTLNLSFTGTSPITVSNSGNNVTIGVTTGTSAGTVATGNHTHSGYVAKLITAASGTATANAAGGTNSVYLNLILGSSVANAHQIVGAGTVTVASNANGKITITGSAHHSTFVKSGSSAAAGLVPSPGTTAGTTKFLCEDATWKVPTDTKNTAGSTDSSSKLFLIGATSQAANPQTYSHDTAYVGTDGCLYSNSTKVSVEGHTHATSITASTSTSNVVALAHGSKYSLTAGGSSVIFTMPASENTDTKVTSVGNHYTPAEDSRAALSASATGATAAWSIDVVKGVSLKRDAKGHVVGISVTSGKIPANPNVDTKVTQTITTASSTSVRPLLLGYAYGASNNTLSGDNFVTVTNTSYASHNVYVKPSTGALYATALYDGGTRVSKEGHTHTTSIATSTSTSNVVALAPGSKYSLTAGGTSVVFTMPTKSYVFTAINLSYTSSTTSIPVANYSPSSPAPSVGDLILSPSNGVLHRVSAVSGTSTTVAYMATLKGDTGPTGPQGPQGSTGASSKWIAGTGVSGNNTTGTIFTNSGAGTTIVGDMYLNTSTCNVYRCTTAGAASVAKWAYVCNIKGASGSSSSSFAGLPEFDDGLQITDGPQNSDDIYVPYFNLSTAGVVTTGTVSNTTYYNATETSLKSTTLYYLEGDDFSLGDSNNPIGYARKTSWPYTTAVTTSNAIMYLTGVRLSSSAYTALAKSANVYMKNTSTTATALYATEFYMSSDIRFKHNISEIDITAENLAKVPLIKYLWKDETTYLLGTSAQDVHTILPELVSIDEEYHLDYSKLGTISGLTACKEIMVLKEEIRLLKEEIKNLKENG